LKLFKNLLSNSIGITGSELLEHILEVDVVCADADVALTFAKALLEHIDSLESFHGTPPADFSRAATNVFAEGLGSGGRDDNSRSESAGRHPRFVGRAVSATDAASACPGLARVACRLAERLPAASVCVVCESRSELLGASPDHEPDATQVSPTPLDRSSTFSCLLALLWFAFSRSSKSHCPKLKRRDIHVLS
jgi:hypothetical protein